MLSESLSEARGKLKIFTEGFFQKRGSIGNSAAAASAKSLQSCLTLCDPIDGRPPGSLVPGIL